MRSRRAAFSLSELLIALAVIAVAALGMLSALSFGLLSTQYAGQTSFAVAYNKKVIELIQSGAVPLNAIATIGPPASPDEAYNSANWRALDGGSLAQTGGAIQQLWGLNSQEYDQWKDEARQCQVNVSFDRLVSGYTAAPVDSKYLNQLGRLTLTTRWPNKGSWRFVRTEAFHVVPATP